MEWRSPGRQCQAPHGCVVLATLACKPNIREARQPANGETACHVESPFVAEYLTR
jgi:hypothetical protein